jgi:hypothetical protein
MQRSQTTQIKIHKDKIRRESVVSSIMFVEEKNKYEREFYEGDKYVG